MITFPVGSYRARCIKVVDGDTFDLHVDLGFRAYIETRFRLLGVDTAELNSKDASERVLAKQARERATSILQPGSAEWNLRIETKKDPDNFGRWLCSVYYLVDGTEVSLSSQLLTEGLAQPYRG